MNLLDISLGQAQQFLAILFRVGAFLSLFPIFGSNNLPAQLKAGLAIVLALVLFPILPMPQVAFPSNGTMLTLALGREVLIGGVLALAVRLIFAGVELAGQVQGYQMGFSIANVLDPQTQEQVSVIAQLHNILALLIFLAIDGHHLMIRALVRSFELVGPFQAQFSGGPGQILISLSSHLFILAVKISSPVLAALFLSNLALGLMARMVPQMHIFLVSMPMSIALGLVILSLSLPFLVQGLTGAFLGLERDFALMLRAMR